MISAIALDDERPALDVVEAFSSQIDFIDLRRTFISTREARYYLEEHPVDLLFSDINMPTQSGIEFYKSIPQKTMVIFTTAYADYAVEGFTLRAIDYLLKPFTYERFLQATRKAHEQYQFIHQLAQPQPLPLVFRVDYGLVTVSVADILFIEGLDNYLKIHLRGQKPVVVRLTMKAMLEKLPPKGFARVHRSFIVALDKITSVRNKLISIGEEEIPLGSTYEEDFLRAFQG